MTISPDKPRVITTIVVDAPIERVWNVLTDIRAYSSWHPSTKLADVDSYGELSVGAKFTLKTNSGTPSELVFSVTVTEVSAPNALRWKGGKRWVFYGYHSWTLKRSDAGTLVTDEEVFSGLLARGVLSKHGAALERQYATGLASLKQRAESLVS
jgi:hypothetical protein